MKHKEYEEIEAILEDAVKRGHATKDKAGQYSLTPAGVRAMRATEEFGFLPEDGPCDSGDK